MYLSLSTAPGLRIARRFWFASLSVIFLVLVATFLVGSSQDVGGTASSSRWVLAGVLFGVFGVFLSPIPVIVVRRQRRIRILHAKNPGASLLVVYMLPQLRSFIDGNGTRSTSDFDQTAIIVESQSSLTFWSGGGAFATMCEIPLSSIQSVSESTFDGYDCVKLMIVGSKELKLVLVGAVFGIDQQSVLGAVARLDQVRARHR